MTLTYLLTNYTFLQILLVFFNRKLLQIVFFKFASSQLKVFFQVTSYVVLDLTPNIEYTYQVRLSPLNLFLWQLSSNLTKRDVTYIFKLMLMDFTE